MVKRYAIRILLVVAGNIMALLFLEIALRCGGDRFSISYLPAFDESTGWTGQPSTEGQDWESKQMVHSNSQGFHDREHSRRKPSNTLRIAVIGDSMTEGAQVSTDKTFPSVLERELVECHARGTRTFEVINFGVGGYSTAQEFLLLNRHVWDYDPDIVLLAFFSGNDIHENSSALDFNRATGGRRPYFRYENGRLVLYYYGAVKHPLFSRIYFWVRQHSRILEAIRRLYFGKIRSRPSGSPASEAAGLPAKIYQSPNDPVLQEAWLVTERLVIAMRDAAAARGAKFMVVTLSTPIQDYPDPRERERFKDGLNVKNLFYPDLRLRALGQREGIMVLNLAPSLAEYADEHKQFLHGFAATGSLGQGHWNEEGHRLAGQLIARQLCAEILTSAAQFGDPRSASLH